MAEEKTIELKFSGIRPTLEQVKLASGGEIDAMIRSIAIENSARFITSDNVQAEVARAKGLDVIYLKPQITDFVPLAIDQFFDEHTIAVYLKERISPMAKKGSISDMKLVKIRDAPTSEYRAPDDGAGDPRAGEARPRRIHRGREAGDHGRADRVHADRDRTPALLGRHGDHRRPPDRGRDPEGLHQVRHHHEEDPVRQAGHADRRVSRRRQDHARPEPRNLPVRQRICRQDDGSPPRAPGPGPDHAVHDAGRQHGKHRRRPPPRPSRLRHLRRTPEDRGLQCLCRHAPRGSRHGRGHPRKRRAGRGPALFATGWTSRSSPRSSTRSSS